MIQDQELRDIYKTSSEEHLQKLETGLLELEKHPENTDSIEELLREAHSLKGDSRIAEVEGVENLAHSVEDILGSIKKHELSLTPDISDRLYETLDAMTKLVHEAVTNEPSGVDAETTLTRLLDTVYGEETDNNDELSLELPIKVTEIDPHPVYIEDDELREIYQVSSIEHISNIKDGISYLEDNTDDLNKFDEVLRELHSLKGDSRIIGVESIEVISHAVEEILKGVKEGELELSHQLGNRILQVFEQVKTIVEESTTGNPSGVNPNDILALLQGKPVNPQLSESVRVDKDRVESFDDFLEDETTNNPDLELEEDLLASLEDNMSLEDNLDLTIEDREIIEVSATKIESAKMVVADSNQESQPVATTKANLKRPSRPKSQKQDDHKIGEPYKIDTIRVQTRHLDALMTQTGELTVTKIRIAHFATQIEEMANLWEDWKTGRSQKMYNRSNSYLSVNEDENIENRLETLIQDLRSSAQDNTTRLDLISDELEEKIRTLRLLPLSNVFHFFPRLVRDLAKQEEKQIDLIIEGEETVADKHILEEIKDPLMHLIRNCVDHGLETPAERQARGKSPTGKIWLRGYQTATNIIIEVKDDGRGLDLEKIKETAIRKGMYSSEELATMTRSQIQSLIFESGFSTRTFITEVSGRGVGLDVVRTNIERLKGNIEIESIPGEGTTFRIQLGTTLATANVLLVKVFGITHAIPIEFVQTTLLVALEEIFTIEGRQTIALENEAVSVAPLAELLELGVSDNAQKLGDKSSYPCILIKIGEEKFGLFVDEVTDTQDVVIKPQSKILKRVRNVTGSTILGTGEVCMILNPPDLLKSIQKRDLAVKVARNVDANKAKVRPTILLAEDSIATRTQEKRILEGAGFEVVTAVDGLDAWSKLKTRKFDAVVSDVQMPNLDGLGFTSKIRQDNQYSELPIILVTSLASDEDKKRGADAGANAYIVKGKFNQDMLIDTLHRLV